MSQRPHLNVFRSVTGMMGAIKMMKLRGDIMSEVTVYSEITPNPNTLKFLVSKQIVERTYDFISKEEAQERSPLALKLFMVQDIEGVYLGKNFVTVTKNSSVDWGKYEDKICDIIEDHLVQGDPVVLEDKAQSKPKKEYEGVEKQINDIIEEEVRPAVAMDGGDIVFKGFEDGIVYLTMMGACAGCPSSTLTLKMGIEARLKEAIPEVKEVVSV